ncbi:MAG: ABC transporter substrate-binding protein [Ruminococcaceae bacterium]|nr:ABC transporter substrate-binding protein [Oscillospiraceae bacterium]
MRITKMIRLACLVLALMMLLTSCEIFQRKKSFDTKQPTVSDKEPPEPSVSDDDNKEEISVQTPEELLDSLRMFDFEGTAIMIAVPENAYLLADSTMSTVLDVIEKKYNGKITLSEYSKGHMYYGVKSMVEKVGVSEYFADLLILSATEYFRFKDADLLERLETLPFMNPNDDCFDAAMTELFSDDTGTYGIVGDGSQLFKSQIVLYVNFELLAAVDMKFDGYAMAERGTWDMQALCKVLAAYESVAGKTALASSVSSEMISHLTTALAQQGSFEDLSIELHGADGRTAFMMGRIPFLIGTVGDMELMTKARDSYGMLPVPYTENGEYKTFYDMDSVYVFCIPKGSSRSDCTGALLEAYHTASKYLPYQYFTDNLIEKYARQEGTIKMIAMIGKEGYPLPHKIEE